MDKQDNSCFYVSIISFLSFFFLKNAIFEIVEAK